MFGVASRSELIAAAGPETLVIASTSAVREAYDKEAPEQNHVKQFTPQLSIPIPRISHLAFSSDEAFLTICADEGGGLQTYDVNAIKQGNTNPVSQLATNGIAVRALVPNPAPDNGHVIAVVLTDGKLMLADLKTKEFINGKNGPILKDGVSCISWSVKGKQLVAGLGNGTVAQLDPAGELKAEIPRPPQIGNEDFFVSGISWLANDGFWIIYTPSKPDFDHAPDSTYMLVERQPKTTNFSFNRMQDPCPPFGMNRSPPHHFNVRLREWPPNLSDVLVVASTASGDVGLVTCSKTALAQDVPHTAGVYTTTSMANDSRKAALPISDDMTLDSLDSSPIGLALDLSSKSLVKRPMPAEEIDQSATPLPAVMVLNNDGVLSTWWFVYSESVRMKTAYPGLISASANQPPSSTQPQQSSGFGFGQSQSSQSAFGQSGGMSAGAFGQPAQPATSAFGAPSALGSSQGSKLPVAAFGSATSLGANKTSAWGSAATPAAPAQGSGSAFGKPAFGAPAQMGAPAFGASGGMGQPKSPWATNTATQSPFGALAAKPATPFGGGNASNASPFATAAPASNGPSSLFGGNVSNSSGFASLTSGSSVLGSSSGGNTSNTFGQPSTGSTAFGAPAPLNGNVFGSAAKPALLTQDSPEADMTDETPVATTPASAQEPATSLFGGRSAFKLGSSFKPDDSAKETPAGVPQSSGFKLGSSLRTDGSVASDTMSPAGVSLFGHGFGKALADTQKPSSSFTPIKEEPKSPEAAAGPSTTPAAPPASGGFVQSNNENKPFVPPTKAALDDVSGKQSTGSAEPPLPPSPTATRNEAAPLPLSPEQTQGPAEEDELSPAGSPAIDLGASGTPESLSPAVSTGSGDATVVKEEEEEEAPLPPDFMPTPSSIPTPTWQFPSTSTPSKGKRPASPDPTASPLPRVSDTPPSVAPTQVSLTPASATKPPYQFQPSSALAASPRSPSPTRTVRDASGSQGMLTPMPPRAESLFSTTPLSLPPRTPMTGGPGPSTNGQYKNAQTPRSPSRLSSVQQAQPEPAQEQHELVDDDDQKIREELAEPVEATKQLAPFIAHQDYAGKIGGQGVPAQVERVYRDINSMVDTLGLNSRSLASFIKGHNELFPDGVRDRADLEDDDDWCLTEIEDLGVVQKDMFDQLQAERPQEVAEKVGEIQDIHRELSKLHGRHSGLQKLISVRQAKDSHARGEQLTTEQTSVLSELRKDFSGFQRLLAQAEEAVSMLKAKVAAAQQASGSAQAGGVPTVEAIVGTIAKMTRMIEQKRGDIDLLEAQMKKLKFKPLPRSARAGTPTGLDEALGRLSIGSGGGGRGSSPFQTPPSSRSKMGASRGTYALTYSPDTSEDEQPNFSSSMRSSMRSSIGPSSRGKGKMPRVSEEAVQAYAAKQQRKKMVMQLLKEKVTAK